MNRRQNFFRCTLLFVLLVAAHLIWDVPLVAQWHYRQGLDGLARLRGPDGDPAITSKFTSLHDSLGRSITWGITPRAIYATDNFVNWRKQWPTRDSETLFNTSIVAGNYNRDSGSSMFKAYTALLESGEVYYFSPFDNYKTANEWSPVSFTFPYEYGTRIKGDVNYYVTSPQSVYVTRDAGSTWQVDMSGVGAGYPSGLSLDLRRYAWLTASSGLYTQHPDSNSWLKVGSFPESSAYSIFHDRRDWTYVSTYSSVYYSTDYGTNWITHTTGLPGEAMSGFADDAFGNVYAVTAGFSSRTKMYRSLGGTAPWIRIDTPITSQMFDPTEFRIINDLSGDTLLIASSILGYWVSRDQGDTWNLADCGLESFIMYGFEELPLGARILSTSLGIYGRGPTDTSWTKRFPVTGYIDRLPLFKDKVNYLYTQALKTDPSNYFSIPYTWRSTDLGIHWVRDDSTGSSLVQNGFLFTVDEAGTQHYATFGAPNQLFKKSFGLPWTQNNLGYTYRTNEEPTFLGCDGHGYIWFGLANLSFANNRPAGPKGAPMSSSGGILWRQLVSGGAWVADTAGLNENAIYALAADSSGNPIVGTYADGLYRRSGGTWSKIPSPPGMTTSSAFVVSVDGSNAIFAGYADLVGSNFLWRGVWFTTDLGTSWTYAGLDSISVRALKSNGDTTFAVTLSDGVYRLTRSGALAVRDPNNRPSSFALSQNYPNPFNPTTVIRYTIPVGGYGNTSLKVYDLLGREVAVLVNERKPAGTYSVQFDGRNLASGVYFYRLEAGSFVATKKLLLLR